MDLIERAAQRAKTKPRRKTPPQAERAAPPAAEDLEAWEEDAGRDMRADLDDLAAEAVAEKPAQQERARRSAPDAAQHPAPRGGRPRRGHSAPDPAEASDSADPIMSRVIAAAAAPPRIGEGARAATRQAPAKGERKSREFKIKFDRLRKFGFITPNERRSRVSEEFRLIKRRLMQRMTLGAKSGGSRRQRGRQHVILVTSARPSEGKSFIAVNLALSIVMDEGFNVMLVDGDVARPSIGRIFGLREDLPGLTDLLLGDTDSLSKVLLREKTLPLSLLAAGGAVASATDLFGGDQMRRMVQDIAGRYDDRIIIFDAPPLLASTEPVALAEHAGQVVLVIDADRTSRAAVDSALDLLETDQNVNLVLNKTTVRNRTEQFGSYYEAYTQSSS